MSQEDKAGGLILVILLALAAFAIPAAMHRHSCASLDVGTVEGCE